MKAGLGHIQGEGCPKKRIRWLFSAISNAPPPPRTAQTSVHSTEMSKLMMEKARRHSDLKGGHQQLNGEETIILLPKTRFINGSGEAVTSHLRRRINLQAPVVTLDFQGVGKNLLSSARIRWGSFRPFPEERTDLKKAPA